MNDNLIPLSEQGVSYYITKRSQFLTFTSITDFV